MKIHDGNFEVKNYFIHFFVFCLQVYCSIWCFDYFQIVKPDINISLSLNNKDKPHFLVKKWTYFSLFENLSNFFLISKSKILFCETLHQRATHTIERLLKWQKIKIIISYFLNKKIDTGNKKNNTLASVWRENMAARKLSRVYARLKRRLRDSLRSNAAAAQYGQFIERGGARSISPRRREGFYLSCDYLFNLKEKQRVRESISCTRPPCAPQRERRV